MYKKIFPAQLDNLYEMLDFVKNFAHNCQISSNLIDQIILASEEALVNIIHYSYEKDQEGVIEIVCEKSLQKSGIKIVIKDQGIPFNPIENGRTSRQLIKQDSVGGYGITLLLELMDLVEYQRINDENILSLTKYT